LSDFAKLALAGNKNAVAKSIEQYKPPGDREQERRCFHRYSVWSLSCWR